MGLGLAITDHPSPNFTPRRDGARADHVVLHYTAMDSAQSAIDRLCDATAEVSAHYVISEHGHVWRLVDEDMRAWHAGAGCWRGISDMNSRSIGIELANRGDHPFPEPQMAALETLLADILERQLIPPRNVIGHSDMAPGRKSDPGPRFDWRRLAIKGLAIWPDTQPGHIREPGRWAEFAQKVGYEVDQTDAPSVGDTPAFAAFRQRFRPWHDGPLDDEDLRIIERLAATSD